MTVSRIPGRMAAILALCFALSACAAPTHVPPARTGESSSAQTEYSSVPSAEDPQAESATADESALHPAEGTTLLFASDYQHRDGWEDPPVTLNKVLDSVYNAGVQPDNYIFCGDYTSIRGKSNYDSNPHDAIEEIKGICLAHDATLKPDDFLFEQGNHDELTEDISASGLHECGDYLVYVINTETDFPWGQGKNHVESVVEEGALRLKTCLDELREQGEARPIFVAGHVPLHFTGRSSSLQGTGDNVYSRHLFQVVQEAGSELNLVFLYGHNHSRGWDSYMGGSCVFREPGDKLLVPDPDPGETYTSKYTVEALRFTYLNAGYVGYFSSAGGENALTCTVCEILPDRLVFTRYDEYGLHPLSSVGTPNPAVDDRELIGARYYGSVVHSPHEMSLRRAEPVERPSAA